MQRSPVPSNGALTRLFQPARPRCLNTARTINAFVTGTLHPLFVQNKVQYYINGDNHHYARADKDSVYYLTTGGYGAGGTYPVNDT
jgi:hypothetical protein